MTGFLKLIVIFGSDHEYRNYIYTLVVALLKRMVVINVYQKIKRQKKQVDYDLLFLF
jgi:hypothetical protein